MLENEFQILFAERFIRFAEVKPVSIVRLLVLELYGLESFLIDTNLHQG